MSDFFRLNTRDLVKGLVVAVISAALGGVYNVMVVGGAITVAVLKTSGMVGVASGISYLLKNLVTNSNDKMLTKETEKNQEVIG